mgnify:CR=1 FL=1
MPEREVIKSIIDFAFIIKAQLHSDETTLLRSILSIAIMESEDLIELLESKSQEGTDAPRRSARR